MSLNPTDKNTAFLVTAVAVAAALGWEFRSEILELELPDMPDIYYIYICIAACVAVSLLAWVIRWVNGRVAAYLGIKPKKYKDGLLNGKTIVVAGASTPLGANCVRKFVELGADVVFLGSDEPKAKKLIEKLKPQTSLGQTVKFFKQNMVEAEQITSLPEKLEKMGISKVDTQVINCDILLQSKFICMNQKFFATEYDKYSKMNHLCEIYQTQVQLPLIKKSAQGRVIYCSSMKNVYRSLDCVNLNFGEFGDGPLKETFLTPGSVWNFSRMASILGAKGFGFYLKRKNAFNVPKGEKFEIKTVSLEPELFYSNFAKTHGKNWFFRVIGGKILRFYQRLYSKDLALKSEKLFDQACCEFEGLLDGSYYCYDGKARSVDKLVSEKVSLGHALTFWNKSIETLQKKVPDLKYF